MDVRKLRYFVAAAEEENFHRAAARAFVAQPALSRYIRQLEDELGVALFERVKKRVRLSPAGVLFLKHAKSILQGVDSAFEETQHVAAGKEGVLKLSFIPSALSYPIVPKSVELFRATSPNVDVDLHLITTRMALAALRSGEIDAAFIHRTPGTMAPEMAVFDVGRLNWVLAVPSNHLLADVSDLRLSDFRGENFLWIPRDQSPDLYDLLVPLCTAAGMNPKVIHSGGDILTYLKLVAAGLGVTITASSIADEYYGGNIVFRKLPELPAPFHIDLVYLKSSGSSVLPRYVSVLRALMKEKGR